MLRRGGTLVLLALLLAITAAAGARLHAVAMERGGDEELLYLPNGEQLRMMSLGHSALMADALYLWAIQYYSNYERKQRQRYVEHVFLDVITELDPYYVDPYWLGALILIVEVGDLEAGLGLLDKGIRNNPDEWVLSYVAAWECYRAEEYERAATYFARAAAVPGAPPAVRRMRAGMFRKSGDIAEALVQWRKIADDPAGDPASVAIAVRQIRELRVYEDLRFVMAAVDRFRAENGRPPHALEELVARAYLPSLPRDPEGREYRYDPQTGRVGSPAGRVLGGS